MGEIGRLAIEEAERVVAMEMRDQDAIDALARQAE